MRFTTVADLTILFHGALWVMRAVVDAIQLNIAIGKRPVHPFGQRFKLRLSKFTTRDTRLVRHNNERVTHLFKFTHGINNAVDKLKLVDSCT